MDTKYQVGDYLFYVGDEKNRLDVPVIVIYKIAFYADWKGKGPVNWYYVQLRPDYTDHFHHTYIEDPKWWRKATEMEKLLYGL